MKVTKLDYGYYQVTHKGRWWTAMRLASNTTHQWHICNETGRAISPEGRVGAVIIAAITKHQEAS